jgi:hypothetical protein
VADTGRAHRSGVPWWAPLLGLCALAGGVAAGVAATHDASPVARPASTRSAVLGTTTAVTATALSRTEAAPKSSAPKADRSLTAAGRPLLPMPADGLGRFVGRYAHARSIRVVDVVGDRIFWVGTGRRDRIIVHLQGHGTRWAIRRGQRLTFTGVVTRNRRGAAAAWGLSRREGSAHFGRQRYHLEVFGPRIRFACVLRCT